MNYRDILLGLTAMAAFVTLWEFCDSHYCPDHGWTVGKCIHNGGTVMEVR